MVAEDRMLGPMLRLHQLPPLDRTSSLSPFCMKVETYLRMTGIPYEAVVTTDPRKGPKGKLPWIEDGDTRLGDSGLILEHLKTTHGDSLDAHLGPREHATGHAVRRMLEEHFYWVTVYVRWFDERHWPRMRAFFLGTLPRPAQAMIGRVALRMMKKTLHAHGLGRHSSDEIAAAGRADLDCVAALLGDKPFLLGDKPSSYDAVVFAFLANVLDIDMDTALLAHARSHANLVAYCDRMKTRYFAAASVAA